MSTEHPSGRRDPADPAPAGARAAACAGDVCRRGRGPLDHRAGAETAAGRRRLPDQRGSVRLRAGHAGAVYRLSRCRHPAAGDDGRHLCLGRPDAVDGAAPDIGLLGIYGSVIAAGIFGILAAPFISRLLPLFPPVVTGTIILVIGISLMRVGINWAGGGLPTLTKVVEGVPGAFPNPGYGQFRGSASPCSCCWSFSA